MDCWSIEHDDVVRDATEEELIQIKEMEDYENYMADEADKILLMENMNKYRAKLFYLEGSFGCGKTTLMDMDFDLGTKNDKEIYIYKYKFDFMDIMNCNELVLERDMRQLLYLNKVKEKENNMMIDDNLLIKENKVFLIDRYSTVSSGLYWLIAEFMDKFKYGFNEVKYIYDKIDYFINKLPGLGKNRSMIIFINKLDFNVLKDLIKKRGYSFEINMDDNELKQYRNIQNFCFKKLYEHYKNLNDNVYLRYIDDLDCIKNNDKIIKYCIIKDILK